MTNENIQPRHPADGAEESGRKVLQLTELTRCGATMGEIARLQEPVARTPEEAARVEPAHRTHPRHLPHRESRAERSHRGHPHGR
jgi:hypothetical protein